MTFRQAIYAAPLIAFGWLATLMTVGYLSDAAPAQIVLFPSKDFFQNLSPDMQIIGMNSWSVTIKSESAGLAKILYGNGAYVVLPSGLKGCIG